MNIDQSQEVIDDYRETRSSIKTGVKFGLSVYTVLDILKKNNIPLVGSSDYNTKHRLKDWNCMSNIDCEWKAYFLGLFCADGSIYKTMCRLGLQKKDSYILHALAKFIFEDTYRVYVRAPKNERSAEFHTLSIYNKHFTADIKKLGITERKSLTLEFPEIPEEFLPHFIRGYFDGDGSISEGRRRKNEFALSIVGSQPFMEALNRILENQNIKSKVRHYCRCPQIRSVVLSSMVEMKKLYHYMYKDATLFLNRKYEIFLRMLENIEWDHPRITGTSKHKYISFCKRSKKWLIRCRKNGKERRFGLFNTEDEAYEKRSELINNGSIQLPDLENI